MNIFFRQYTQERQSAAKQEVAAPQVPPGLLSPINGTGSAKPKKVTTK
jgi:hypothetical protein